MDFKDDPRDFLIHLKRISGINVGGLSWWCWWCKAESWWPLLGLSEAQLCSMNMGRGEVLIENRSVSLVLWRMKLLQRSHSVGRISDCASHFHDRLASASLRKQVTPILQIDSPSRVAMLSMPFQAGSFCIDNLTPLVLAYFVTRYRFASSISLQSFSPSESLV